MKNDRMICSPEDKRKVACFLGTFGSGVGDDYGTPILGSSYRCPGYDKDRARKWLGDKLWVACDLSTLPFGLDTFELEAQSHHGSISRRPPYAVTQHMVGDSLKCQVEAVRKRHPVVLKSGAARVASDFVRRLYPVGKLGALKPISLGMAATKFPNDTSLGFPRFVSGRSYWREYLIESLRLESLGFPLSEACQYHGLIGARSVARGPYMYSKTRYITQWSRVLANIEKTIFVPLSTYLRRLPTFCALVGPDAVDKVMTQLLGDAQNPYLSLDFSGFDASVPFEVIAEVFAILHEWFGESCRDRINFIHRAFVGTGLLVPGALIRDRARGIPSGSVLTNLIDSLVNLWVIAYGAALNGGSILRALVQGDDGVYSFRGLPDITILGPTLESELGMTIKMTIDKNLISSREVVYLQNHHYTDYKVKGLSVGVRPVMRAVCNMFGHERAPAAKAEWLSKYNTYRYLQQANNSFHHPRFRQLCVWLWTYDTGYLREALGRIVRQDAEVAVANNLLNVGDGERGKIAVCDLRWSPVVQTLLSIAREKRVSL